MPHYLQHWLDGIRDTASNMSNSYAKASIFHNAIFIKLLQIYSCFLCSEESNTKLSKDKQKNV